MNCKTTLFATLLLALPLAGEVSCQDLHLKSRLICETGEISLGAVLEEGEASPLAGKIVARAPDPGRRRELSRARLQRRLWDWGWRGHLRGAELVTLETPALKLSTAPLMESVNGKLDALLRLEGLRRSGEIKGWPESLTLSDSQVRWDVQLRGKREFRNRSAGLVVSDSRGFEERIVLRFHCEMPMRVPVATRDMSEGSPAIHWALEERDGFYIDGRPLDSQDLSGALCSRDIQAGSTLSDRNVSTGILVRAGREVEIRLARGAVTVVMRGVAQADGAFGDRVTVRHLDDQELRRYRVTGQGRVAPLYLEDEGEAS